MLGEPSDAKKPFGDLAEVAAGTSSFMYLILVGDLKIISCVLRNYQTDM